MLTNASPIMEDVNINVKIQMAAMFVNVQKDIVLTMIHNHVIVRSYAY